VRKALGDIVGGFFCACARSFWWGIKRLAESDGQFATLPGAFRNHPLFEMILGEGLDGLLQSRLDQRAVGRKGDELHFVIARQRGFGIESGHPLDLAGIATPGDAAPWPGQSHCSKAAGVLRRPRFTPRRCRDRQTMNEAVSR